MDPCPEDDYEDCGACSGEACYQCGAGMGQGGQFLTYAPCDHDVIERHSGPWDPRPCMVSQ